MGVQETTDAVVSLIPVAATVAVAGKAFGVFSKPLKKVKQKSLWW
jgi:hypothetical protein